MANLDDLSLTKINNFVKNLIQYDYIIIDTSPGINKIVVNFSLIANYSVIITNDDIASITGSYQLIKVLVQKGYKNINLLFNKALNFEEAYNRYMGINNTTKQFLNYNCNYLGFISNSKLFNTSLSEQIPFMASYAKTSIGYQFNTIAKVIDNFDNQNKIADKIIKPFIREHK